MRNMSDIDRTSTEAPKEGMFTGSYAVNPMSGEQVPVWIANYVSSRLWYWCRYGFSCS